MDIQAELEKRGLQVTYEEEYPPEGGEPTLNKNQVRGLFFPLTNEEWCELCMNEGQFYVGGCCGQTSAIQDLFMGIFRESGVAKAAEILELMQSASRHDGFEEYSLEWNGDLEKLVSEWETLSPIKKIGICCQAMKEKLKPVWVKLPRERRDTEDWCDILEGSLQLLRFRDLMKTDGDKSQKHANREVLLARILPACQKVLEKVIPRLAKPFRGFAVTKKGSTEILSDGYGLCVYETEKKAKTMIALWGKNADEDDKKLLGKIEVKPVSIGAKTGIVWK